MNSILLSDTVGGIVTRNLELSRLFEEVGIDYCCHGGHLLSQALEEKNLDSIEFMRKLEEYESSSREDIFIDVSPMSLTELIDHIIQVHHLYLRNELDHLTYLAGEVARAHKDKDHRLEGLVRTVSLLATELGEHMLKEEQMLFPMIRELDASSNLPDSHCGSIANPIRVMESEHDLAGTLLEDLSEISDQYTPPTWACTKFRVLLNALSKLEHNLHVHIHKENNILFPRALKMEREKITS